MKRITLFEIPIYSMSKKEFKKRWRRKKEEVTASFLEHGHSKEDAKLYLSLIDFPKNVWKYNQIIGYIKISVSMNEVYFDIYQSLDKRYIFNSKKKHFIQNVYINGMHFYFSNPNNKEIKDKIIEELKVIEKDYVRKSFFIDYSTFNNIIEYLNIEKLMKSII